MKKSIFLLVFICILTGLQAQNFLISFAGSGESSMIDSIKVENLTQGTNVTLDGGESLRLKSVVTNLDYQDELRNNKIYIYPNPVTDYANLELDVIIPDKYTIDISDLSGRTVVQTADNLSQGRHRYQIIGLRPGIYTVKINSDNYFYTGKIICGKQNYGITQIKYRGQSDSPASESYLKSAMTEYEMQYNWNNRLKFTAFSGNYSTILIDIPDRGKIITFEFVDCTDGDNNSYAVVKIGTQIWMAENLGTTRYNDGSSVPLVSDNNTWRSLETPAYCWYNNDSGNFATEYGALYDWYSFETDSLCPVGWHVPSNEEWTILETYLEDNGYGHEGSGDDIGKSLSSTSGWTVTEIEGAVGNDQKTNNLSGFSALPGGQRQYDGTFIDLGDVGNWWSSSGTDCVSDFRTLHNDGSNINTESTDKETGFSVRCIKD